MLDIGKIYKVKGLDELSLKAAEIIIYEGQQAIERSGRYMLALSGGRTPQSIYKLLASSEYKNQLDWTKVCVFFTDERCVPPEHQDSNYGMIKKLLLDNVSVRHVFRMQGEAEKLDEAALAYEKEIKEIFNLADCEIPKFDLTLLGIGKDGHVASIFKNSDSINTKDKLVCTTYVDDLKAYRLTLTMPILDNVSFRLFIINGKDKQTIVDELSNNININLPISRMNFLSGVIQWIIATN